MQTSLQPENAIRAESLPHFKGLMSHPDYRSYLLECMQHPQILIEISSKCNFHCPYCISSTKPRPKTFMDRDLFSRLVRQAKDLTRQPLCLHVDGEPTLHPHFHDMALEANSLGHRIALASNGSNLRPEFLDINMSLLTYVSSSPEELAQRSGIKFDNYLGKLLDYVRHWMDTDNRQSITYIIYFNREDLRRPEVIERKTGFARTLAKILGIEDQSRLGAASGPLLKYARKNGGTFTVKRLNIATGGTYPGENPRCSRNADLYPSNYGFCDSPFKRLAVLADGRVSYCCVDLTGGTAYTEAGETWEKGLAGLWLEDGRINAVRDGMIRAMVDNPTCRSCLLRAPDKEFYVSGHEKFETENKRNSEHGGPV